MPLNVTFSPAGYVIHVRRHSCPQGVIPRVTWLWLNVRPFPILALIKPPEVATAEQVGFAIVGPDEGSFHPVHRLPVSPRHAPVREGSGVTGHGLSVFEDPILRPLREEGVIFFLFVAVQDHCEQVSMCVLFDKNVNSKFYVNALFALQDIFVARLPVTRQGFLFILCLRFVLLSFFEFVPVCASLHLEFCHLPIKNMMRLSLFLSYTASILFDSGGRPIQKFWIRAGLWDTNEPSLLVLQNCAPLSKKRTAVCSQCAFIICSNSHKVHFPCCESHSELVAVSSHL